MDSKRWAAVVLTALAFWTLPVSAFSASPEDEAAVKLALQTYVDLDKKGDVDGLLTCYADDAKIDSIVARGKVTKGAYAAAMKQAQAQGHLSRNHEAKIRSLTFPNPNQAVLEFDYDMDSSRGGRRSTTLRWAMANREGRWLIVDTEYLKK
jgi:ketosteroid isomerase-like protein